MGAFQNFVDWLSGKKPEITKSRRSLWQGPQKRQKKY